MVIGSDDQVPPNAALWQRLWFKHRNVALLLLAGISWVTAYSSFVRVRTAAETVQVLTSSISEAEVSRAQRTNFVHVTTRTTLSSSLSGSQWAESRKRSLTAFNDKLDRELFAKCVSARGTWEVARTRSLEFAESVALAADTSHPQGAGSGLGNGTIFTVEQYRVTSLNLNAFDEQADVVGGSNPADWRPKRRLTVLDGYQVQNHTCVVKRRCDAIDPIPNDANDAYFGRDYCPFSERVDIALVHCPYRTQTLFSSTALPNWLEVASVDTGTERVEVWWFHEVVYLATTQTRYVPGQPYDNFLHYLVTQPCPSSVFNCVDTTPHAGTPPGGLWSYASWPKTKNYHYRRDKNGYLQQLFPLRSYRSAQGASYSAKGSASADLYYANVPVCHGTSGSGVVDGSNYRYLGPAIGGNVNNKLCHAEMTNPSPNGQYMTYVKTKYSRQLRNLPEVNTSF